MLPNFLCIGAQKAGTTWLHAQLETHPEVWFPPIKEIHYFDHRFVDYPAKGPQHFVLSGIQRAIKVLSKRETPKAKRRLAILEEMKTDMFSEAWYRRIYSHAPNSAIVVGDITPGYSMLGPDGVEEVKRLLGPGLKVIYLIRDPVSRAVSQIKMRISRNPALIDRVEDLMQKQLVLKRSKYSEAVPLWNEAFGDNLLILPFRRIATDPGGLMAEVEGFLGIKAKAYPKASEAVHVTKEIEVPYNIQDYFKRELASEQDYIRREFGEEFAAQT